MPARTLELLAALRPVALFVLSGLLAAGTAFYFDWTCSRRKLLPPGFRVLWRRALAFAVLALLFWVAVFSPLAMIGTGSGGEVNFEGVSLFQLFALQLLLAFVTLSWFALGFAVRPRPRPAPAVEVPAAIEAPQPDVAPLDVPDALGAEMLEALREPHAPREAELPEIPADTADGQDEILFEGRLSEDLSPAPVVPAPPVEPGPPPVPPTLGRQFAAQLGFRAPSPLAEIGFGLVAGFAIWFAVIAALFVIALVVTSLGGERYLPKQAPAMIPWIAGLPVGIRLLLSLSAGVVEETFFRGLLQPRVGIAFSTACFVLAHAAYGQPFMLVGVTLLSLIYAFLVRWRQNLWPAIVAHALFDAVQLLVVIPAALKFMRS